MCQQIQRCHLFIENMPDAFACYRVILDEKGNPVDYEYLDVNSAFQTMTGLKKDHIIGKKAAEVLHDTEHLMEHFCHAVVTGRGSKFEIFLEPLGCRYQVTAYCPEPGYLAAVFQDITQRRQDDEKRREEESRLRELFEGSRDGLVVININGKILEANTAFCQMVGYSLSELSQMESFYTITVERWRKWEQEEILNKQLKGCGFSGIYEKEYIRKDGCIIPVELQAYAVYGDQEEIKYLWAVVRDITQRKQVENALRESQKYNRSILELIPDIIIRADKEGRCLDIIVSSEDQLYLPKNELLGKKIQDIMPQEEVSYFTAHIEKAINLNTLQVIEYKLNVPAGNLWFEARIFPLGKNEIIALIRDITEHKNANEKLKASEQFLQTIIDNMFDMVSITDMKGNYKFVGASHKILGYNLDNLLNKNVLDFVHPKDFQRVSFKFKNYLSSKSKENSEKIEYRYRCADGSYLWLETVGKFIVDENNNPKELLFSTRNVTNRKQVEQALIEGEKKFRSYMENAPLGIAIANSDGKYLEVNQKMLELSGYTEQELLKLSRGIGSFIAEESLQKGLEHFETVKREGYARGEYLFQRKDGKKYWTEIIAAKINEDRFIGFHSDISSRKEAEDNYQLLVENSTDIIYKMNSKGVFTFVSPAWTDLLGHPVEEIVNKQFHPMVHPDDLDRCLEFLQKVLKTRKKQSGVEYRVKHADGSWRWHTTNAAPLGNVFIGVARDITDRKKAEDKIRYMSFHDSLTGLYNRTYLEQEMQRMDTKRQLPVSIVMADLNGLKLINDTYGHGVGDEMLVSAAKILKNFCRKEDIVARWSGDEFIIFLPQTTITGAQEVCNRIVDACRVTDVKKIPLSMALGVGSKKSMETKLTDVLKEAEDSMYKHKLAERRSTKSAVLNALLKTLEEKSYETKEHARRMQEIAMKIGKKISLPETELDRLTLLVYLHDIGKITVPEETLTKKEKLTEKDWEHIKKHPESGYRIARSMEEFAHIAEDILCHHEHWDGSGYPKGLKGKEIPLLARIAAIVDAYEVMTNGRPYKEPLSHGSVIAELKRCAGTQFDPELVEVFISIFDEHLAGGLLL